MEIKGLAFKIIGSILILGSCTTLGISGCIRMRERLEEIYDLRYFYILLRSELSYRNVPFTEAFANMVPRMKGSFLVWLSDLSRMLEESVQVSFFELWEDSIEKNMKHCELPKKSKQDLIEFGKQAGYMDLDMQLKAIDLELDRLHKDLSDMQREIDGKTRIYRCLGVSSGILLCLILS